VKSSIQQIVGKTISGVIAAERASPWPKSQLFLVFDDGTYYEIYSGEGRIAGTSGCIRGGANGAKSYLGAFKGMNIVFESDYDPGFD
jgi:hypothetical protein